MRILVIDDSRTMRALACSALEAMGGHELEMAADGQEALARVESFEPELIVLDWNMPIMNGLEFLEAYRSQGCAAPVIMVTTEAEDARADEALAAGANSTIVKPFTDDLLQAQVQGVLAKHAA